MIALTAEECMLVDWLLTAHSFSGELMDFLSLPTPTDIRRKVASVILEKRDYIDLNREELVLLLKLCPFTFRFGQKDCGYSLKLKLYAEYYGAKPALNLNLEIIDATNPDNNRPYQDPNTNANPNTATSSPTTSDIPVPTGESVPRPDEALRLMEELGFPCG